MFPTLLCISLNRIFIVAYLLKVLDFPPLWGILDAHSLWHAATIPLGPWWYYFWELDDEDDDPIPEEGRQQQEEQEKQHTQ